MTNRRSGDYADDDYPFEFEDVDRDSFRDLIAGLPLPAPPEIADHLERLGYKGQDEARRAMALMAYRHVRRLKRLHVEGADRAGLPPKQNVLLVGPTGCGKTFLVEMLFQHVFKLPTVIVDITGYTESGYVGDDVHTILTQLIGAADGNLQLAACGVVCLDEFDKIASSGSNARFAGQGTTKDVSGYGVQRELLAMLAGAEVMVPMDYGFSAYGNRAQLTTRDLPFIACGAFSGMEGVLKGRASIGFHDRADEAAAVDLTLDDAAAFQKYGFLPELIGRFSRIVNFPALPAETLRRILAENVLPQFAREFSGEGLRLTVTAAALDHIIVRSQRRGTGARGLHAELVAAVEGAAYENFGRVAGAEVVIDVTGDRLQGEVRRRA